MKFREAVMKRPPLFLLTLDRAPSLQHQMASNTAAPEPESLSEEVKEIIARLKRNDPTLTELK